MSVLVSMLKDSSEERLNRLAGLRGKDQFHQLDGSGIEKEVDDGILHALAQYRHINREEKSLVASLYMEIG